MDQKILWDCHMHSSFSADSDTPMEEMIQTAADQGLTGICFTEHFDPDYPDTLAAPVLFGTMLTAAARDLLRSPFLCGPSSVI